MSFRAIAFLVLAAFSCAQAGGIYWTDRGASQLKRMGFNGSNLTVITVSGAVTSPGSNIRGIAFDGVSNRLFWADNGADRLLRAGRDGSASAILYTISGGGSFPADVRLDLGNQLLYWCDQQRNRIQRSTLEGGSVTDVITTAAPTGPYFMDLDVAAGKIYWGDFDGGFIYRANLDGSARETLLSGNNRTRGVRVDPRERMLYWVNRDDKKIHRCALSAFEGGTIPLTHPAVQTLYTNLDTPHGLVLDIPARKLYWADTGSNPGAGLGGQAVSRGDFDGSTPVEVLAVGSEPWDVDIDPRCANYAEWVTRCFRRDASAEQTNVDADPDGDGIPNAVEYAFDLSPLHADIAGVPRGFIAAGPLSNGDYHAVEYRRRVGATDLTYDVQASTNLVNWTSSATNSVTLEIASTPLGDGVESATARTVYTVSGYPAHFMRVRITLAP